MSELKAMACCSVTTSLLIFLYKSLSLVAPLRLLQSWRRKLMKSSWLVSTAPSATSQRSRTCSKPFVALLAFPKR
ncbi:hypothetical protein ACFPRL_20205 [Pseudoclavibacter helvolus]